MAWIYVVRMYAWIEQMRLIELTEKKYIIIFNIIYQKYNFNLIKNINCLKFYKFYNFDSVEYKFWQF